MTIVDKLISFVQGVNGYSGTVDTYVMQASKNTANGSDSIVRVDHSNDINGLLRFDNLFGDLPNQIPAGAHIVSATLSLETTNGGSGAELHRMLAPWQEASTWNSLVNGVQADGVEAVSSADAVTGSVTDGVTTIDVTSSIEAWLNGAANYGWAFLSLGSNGWRFSSSEGGTPPRLDIAYTIDDGGTPTNTPPVAADDSATLSQDSSVAIQVLANDTDTNGDTLSVTGLPTGPAHGTAAINPDGSIQYTPQAGFAGPDSFTYAISDGQGGSATASVQLTVDPIVPDNTPPVAMDDGANVPSNGSVAIDVLANDTDADGNGLSISGILTAPAHGAVTVNPNGTITFAPVANYAGPDSFIYGVSDGNGGIASATVNVQVPASREHSGGASDQFFRGRERIFRDR